MARFGFCGPAYQSTAQSADAESLKNFYLEQDESGAGKSGFILCPSPGLSLFSHIVGTQVRGSFFEPVTQRAFAVIDDGFYEISSLGANVKRGTVVNDKTPASLTGWATKNGAQQILVVSAQQGYVFDLITGLLTVIAQGTLPTPLQVAASDTFFVALCNDNVIRASKILDATQWPGLQLFAVSVFSDILTSILIDHRELLVLGSQRGQFYYDSGSVNIFDPIPDGIVEQGSAARFGISRLGDNSFAWWGKNEQGGLIAWRANGRTPVRISTHAIENEICDYPRIDDAVSYSFQDRGHTFWRTRFPSANNGLGKTWQYDAATGTWAEVTYWDGRQENAHRSSCHMFAFGRHLVGDTQSGDIYEMRVPQKTGTVWTFATDFGNPIRRVRRSPYVGKPEVWNYFNRLEIEADQGLGPQPPLIGGTPQGEASIILADSLGALWALSITDGGPYQVAPVTAGTAQTFILNDTDKTTAWKFTVTGGLLTRTQVAYDAQLYSTFKNFVTPLGKQGVFTIQGGIVVTGANDVTRGPQAAIRSSNDGANTWSSERIVDFGQSGQYGIRAILRRLGRCWGTKGRVFELVYTDPVPLRITDAYLDADPEMKPSERLSKQLARSA